MFRALAVHYTGVPARRQISGGAWLSLPLRPTQRSLTCFDGCWSHTHGHQTARAYDLAALNLVGPCEVVFCERNLAWAGNGTFLPKSSRQQLGGEGWVA